MTNGIRALSLPLLYCFLGSAAWAESVEVTAGNFIRAETDFYMAKYVAQAGIGRMAHTRVPTPVADQDVIRMNRDTIYSGGVFDLTQPVTITLPSSDGRFQSMQVINQDHYTVAVEYAPGTHTFTKERVGTRYMIVIIRTFMDPNDEADIAFANKIQDLIEVQQADRGAFEAPDWDPESLSSVRGLLLALAATMPDSFDKAFGSRDEVDPIIHLLGTAAGWGGNPPSAAVYPSGWPEKNDGKTPYAVTVTDVPVDGFWSITVYNEDGFMQKNDLDVYSFNGVTADKNDDGSITIHFGSCDDGRVNCIPITEGWNYAARLYRPRPEVLDGSWKFPEPQPVN